MTKTAKFNIGDIVLHARQGYRAVVVDIDPIFQASGRHNPQALTRDFASKNPWYRLLVDSSSQITYVEEPLLKRDPEQPMIDNPKVNDYLIQVHGNYFSNIPRH